MESLYIRQPNEEQGRGPYNQEQLESLAATGHILPDTLFSTDNSEWFTVQARPDLYIQLFPPQKTIRLKKSVHPATPDATATTSAATTEAPQDELTRILKGDSKATKKETPSRVAALLTSPLPWVNQLTGLVMLLAAWTFLTHNPGKIVEVFSNPILLLEHPTLAVGMIDLLVTLFLFLGASGLHSYVRSRLLVMAGVALIYFWTDTPFDYSTETWLAAGGVLLLTGFNRGIVQVAGGLIAILALLPIALSGYNF